MQIYINLLNIPDKFYEIFAYTYVGIYKDEIWISEDTGGKWDLQ